MRLSLLPGPVLTPRLTSRYRGKGPSLRPRRSLILQRHQHVRSPHHGSCPLRLPASPGSTPARHQQQQHHLIHPAAAPVSDGKRSSTFISFLLCQQGKPTLPCIPPLSKTPWPKCTLASWALTGMRRVQYVLFLLVLSESASNIRSTPSTTHTSPRSRRRRSKANNGPVTHGHRSRTSPWLQTSPCNNHCKRPNK